MENPPPRQTNETDQDSEELAAGPFKIFREGLRIVKYFQNGELIVYDMEGNVVDTDELFTVIKKEDGAIEIKDGSNNTIGESNPAEPE